MWKIVAILLRIECKFKNLHSWAKKLNVGYGAVTSDKNDANKLVATTCAQWYSQSWTEDAWDRDAIAWGDRFFKSEDGGETWTEIH